MSDLPEGPSLVSCSFSAPVLVEYSISMLEPEWLEASEQPKVKK